MVALLILTQRTWATPTQSANAPGASATTINYQGRLADTSGNPKNGTFSMTQVDLMNFYRLFSFSLGNTLPAEFST